MSYDYYGYGYGDDSAPAEDTYYEEPAEMWEEDDDDEKSPIVMAYLLVPVLDAAAWYVTNDKWSSANNSDWDNAAMAMLGGAIYKAVFTVGAIAAKDIFEMPFFFGAAISVVQEAVSLYLVNNAEGSAASDSNSTTIAYALNGVSAALSAAAFVTMMGMEKDDDEDMEMDGYYEEEPAEEEGGDDYGYSGYYY